MNTPTDASAMPAEMLKKLRAVQRHDRSVRLQTGLTRACAVLITAMLVMMAVDWLATPHEGPWRWIMTISALSCGVVALLLGCMIPLLRSRSLDSVAEDVDRAHPSLEERYQTITEFAQSKDTPEIRGSEGMIRKVAQQTAALSGTVVPGAVVSKKGLLCAGKFFGAAAAVLALFFIVDFPQARVLTERFFQPGADITLTHLQSKTGDLFVGKGEDVTLEFTATGKATDSAKLSLIPEAGRDEVVALAKDAKESTASASKFVYTANAVTTSFAYSARSGDGQTDLHHVTVLERPKLAQVQLRVEAPAYSQLPVVNEKSLPRQFRALEGSKMEISFLPDQDLASLDLKFSDGSIKHLEKGADKNYHFNTVLSNSMAFEPILTNSRHLDNPSRPNCEIVVYQDQPPTVNITSPSDQITARPDDKIQIEFEARDDFGLSKAELVVTVQNDDGSNAPPVVFPIPLDQKEIGSKLIKKQVDLDLAQFNLKQDQELNYSIRVTDTRNDSSFSTPLPDSDAARQAQASQLAQNQNSQPNDPKNQAQQNNGQNQSQPNTAQNQADQNNSQNQSQPNNGQNQSRQNMAQNQSQQSNGQNQSQQNTAQNQFQQSNAQNQSQPNTAQNQSQQNTAQNQSQQSNGQNQSQPNTAQNQSQQNNGQNQSQQNTAQNQSQQSDAQNQSQQNMAQNQSRPNNPQNPGQPNSARIQSQQNNGQNQSQQNTAQNQSQQNNSQNQPQQNTAQNQADNQNQNQDQNTPPSQDQNHIAMASPKADSQSSPPSGSSQPPPNAMTKRALDVASGQTSSAQPMRITVDQFARSFDGQMREKQELAIDPVLKLLDELLRKAHDLTETNLVAAQSKAGLGVEQAWALDESKDQVRQADRAVVDLKKNSVGTPYAFIGLQVSDIGDTHIAPAREELGEVTLESAKAKEDLDNLTQASFHLDQARKMLADLTKTYESVKRDNKLADAMQELKKMHQIFLEDTQAMLGSKKPPINSVGRKVAEVDDDYAAKLQQLLEEQKKIMAELAKILADDPRMLRRFMALQELDGTSLRDQMTLLAERQKTLTKETAEWTVADETTRPALANRYLIAQASEQNEVSTLAAKMHENMITWLPDGVEQDQEPVATAVGLAAQGARLAALAASEASPDTITNSLETARKALDQFRLLHDYLPDMPGEADTKNLGVYTANRLNEADELVTKESGWIKKMESLRGGDFSQSVEVDEHRLALDTKTLSEKLDAQAPSLAALSPEIEAKSDQLTHTVEKQVLPQETRAVDALARKTLKDAVSRQEGADTAFADAETQFDELLRMIVAKLDSAPPPTDPGQNPTLEEMLAMLKDEKKAAEGLGIPNRPINVQIMRDWLSPSSGQQAGGGSGGQRQSPGGRAQARAAQQQARDASQRTGRASDQARRNAQLRAAQLTQQNGAVGNSNEGGPKAPSNGWNTLASKLGDELRQSRDNVPPEQYRQAIEQYFNSISETVPAAPADGKEKNP